MVYLCNFAVWAALNLYGLGPRRRTIHVSDKIHPEPDLLSLNITQWEMEKGLVFPAFWKLDSTSEVVVLLCQSVPRDVLPAWKIGKGSKSHWIICYDLVIDLIPRFVMYQKLLDWVVRISENFNNAGLAPNILRIPAIYALHWLNCVGFDPPRIQPLLVCGNYLFQDLSMFGKVSEIILTFTILSGRSSPLIFSIHDFLWIAGMRDN